MSEPEQGKPPKSKESIRSSLNALRKKDEQGAVLKKPSHSGPMINGFSASHQITAGTFHDVDIAKQFQALLMRAGIFSKMHSSRHGSIVMVDAEDSQKAAEIFIEHKKENPDRPVVGSNRRFDYLIFGVLIGITFGIVLLGNEYKHPMAYLVFATFLAIGASVGHLFDRLRIRYRKTGQLKVGVWEFLIIATLPALFALVFTFLPDILFGSV